MKTIKSLIVAFINAFYEANKEYKPEADFIEL